MVSAFLDEGSADDDWDGQYYSESDVDEPESPELDPEKLPESYDRIIEELEKDEEFPKKVADALDGKTGFVWTVEGQPLDLRCVEGTASDGSTILHHLVEAVHHGKLEAAHAERLTRVLARHNRDLFTEPAGMPQDFDDRPARAGRNALELALLYPECLEIVKAICEHGMVEIKTRGEKAEMEKKRNEKMMARTMEDLRVTTPRTPDSGVAMSTSVPRFLGFGQVFTTFSTTMTNVSGADQGAAVGFQEAESNPAMIPGATTGEPQDDLADRFVEVADEDCYIYRRVFWKELIRDNHSSCLHLAIKTGNNECAKYLLERIRLTKETESVLGCRNEQGLTLLHLAVDFEKCSEEQVDFVRLLISLYPDALAPDCRQVSSSGRPVASSVNIPSSRFDPGRSRAGWRPQDNGMRPLKSTAAPYKHFLRSKEEALNSNDQPSQPGASKPSARHGAGGASRSTGGTRKPPHVHARKALAPEKRAAAQKMADLLKLSCMRHFGRDRSKLRELLESQNQIHLDLNPRTRVTPQLLDYIASKKLESFLQYVYIPNLRVLNVHNKDLERSEWWESTSRKDYAYIFAWLRDTAKVTKIVRVIVEDDQADFHSDEVIEHSLKGFDVEEWNWFKWDLCSDTILAAAPNVRVLNLYWSGNRAILKSWAAGDGLVQLEHLEHIYIRHPQSKESRKTTHDLMLKFKEALKAAWKQKWNKRVPRPDPPGLEFMPFTTQGYLTQTLSEKELEEKGKKDRWLKCTESFAKLLKKWFNQQLSGKDVDGQKVSLAPEKEIRVAVIDDGADIDSDDLAENVETGETFYDSEGHWPGYYQSSRGHGHLMALLIRNLCPRVRLYIAKLNEFWIDGRPRFTPESAAEAIDWAREKNVDIISMSWSIERVDEPARTSLKEAVRKASKAGILLFCACDGQGNLSSLPYPAKDNETKVLKIGSANALGIRDDGTKDAFFDYIAPGLEDGHDAPDESGAVASRRPLFASSIATARCAGLAALILQCIVLVFHPDDCRKQDVRKIDNMRKMFDRMVEKQDKNNYIKVWKVFEEAMNQAPGLADDLEGGIIKTVAGEFIKMVEWKQLDMGPPRVTVEPRVRTIPGPEFALRPPPMNGMPRGWGEASL